MNTLILSGKVLDNVRRVNKAEQRPHAVFQLWIATETRSGVKNEAYWINCWGGTAEWALEYVKRDDYVTIVGGLTQYRMDVGGKTLYPNEIAAEVIRVGRDVLDVAVRMVDMEVPHEAD